MREAKQLEKIDTVPIPESFNFKMVEGLSNEAKERLIKIKPCNLGQASRLEGVSAADISILMIALNAR